MALFPVVQNGLIVGFDTTIFAMAPSFIHASDVSALNPQPQIGWGAVEANSAWTFTAPPTPAPTLAQQAGAAYSAYINSGLTITSPGTPSLDGVYALDPTTQSDIANEAQFISTFSEFTNGGTTALQWPLQNGTLVSFPSTTEFLALAKVTAQSVAAAKLAASQIANGVTGVTMPSATADIP
jgi:hypothetical protein